MVVRVLFFASAREITGTASIEIDLHDGATVNELREELLKRFPSLEGIEKKFAIALNEEYVVDDSTLGNGDEVALIPPVSGG
ncbi:MAG: molybdopterin converting factor subunit 1 [Candidatus Latescibacterota bacterium]|nr:molybdopterin converting factor subunit 1 [Candidatus Latescibacterota bacterium]